MNRLIQIRGRTFTGQRITETFLVSSRAELLMAVSMWANEAGVGTWEIIGPETRPFAEAPAA